jgi:hypothetical protein
MEAIERATQGLAGAAVIHLFCFVFFLTFNYIYITLSTSSCSFTFQKRTALSMLRSRARWKPSVTRRCSSFHHASVVVVGGGGGAAFSAETAAAPAEACDGGRGGRFSRPTVFTATASDASHLLLLPLLLRGGW